MKKYILLSCVLLCVGSYAFAEIKEAQVRKRTVVETEISSEGLHSNRAIKLNPDGSSNSTVTNDTAPQASTIRGGNLVRDIYYDGYQNIYYDTNCVYYAKQVSMSIGLDKWYFDQEEEQLLCEVPSPVGRYYSELTYPNGPAACAQSIIDSTYVYRGTTYYFVDPYQADVKTTSYPLSFYDVAYLCAGSTAYTGSTSQSGCIYERMITYNYTVDQAYASCKNEAYTTLATSSASRTAEPFFGLGSVVKDYLGY